MVWFGLPQRRPYIHVVEALTKSIAFGNQVSSVNTITVTLISISLREIAHEEGVSVHRIMLSTLLHTKPEGR